MQAVRSIVRPRGRSVRLTVPSAFIGLDVEVLAFPLEGPASKGYDFSDLSGKLEWRGDAVREQRVLRDEW